MDSHLSTWGGKVILDRVQRSGFFSFFVFCFFLPCPSLEGSLAYSPGKAHPHWLFVPFPVDGSHLELFPLRTKLGQSRGTTNVCWMTAGWWLAKLGLSRSSKSSSGREEAESIPGEEAEWKMIDSEGCGMLGREKSRLAAATGQPGHHCLGCTRYYLRAISSSFCILGSRGLFLPLFSLSRWPAVSYSPLSIPKPAHFEDSDFLAPFSRGELVLLSHVPCIASSHVGRTCEKMWL